MPRHLADVAQETDHRRHDLNTPLTIIHLRTQLLQRRLGRNPCLSARDRQRLQADLDVILNACRRLGVAIHGGEKDCAGGEHGAEC